MELIYQLDSSPEGDNITVTIPGLPIWAGQWQVRIWVQICLICLNLKYTLVYFIFQIPMALQQTKADE